eukprot:475347-Pyramimonas_sp.AAC.1
MQREVVHDRRQRRGRVLGDQAVERPDQDEFQQRGREAVARQDGLPCLDHARGRAAHAEGPRRAVQLQ